MVEALEGVMARKNSVEVSRILVGTSPFIAAGRFKRSHQYYLEFVLRRGRGCQDTFVVP